MGATEHLSGDERRRAAAVALGESPADAVIRGGRLVDVYGGVVRDADLAIAAGRIALVGDVGDVIGSHTVVHEVNGAALAPGLIDTHLHLVGGQLTMAEYARQVVALGTAAVSVCFYETGIVGGDEGLAWIRSEARRTHLRALISPFISCYRALGAFGNPRRVSREAFLDLLNDPDCVEIREWNIHLDRLADPVADELVRRARIAGKVVSGHLEGMSGPELQASIVVGAVSDHEVVDVAQALERVALGVHVQIRDGSGARDFDRVIPAITEFGANPRFFSFCTDGQEAQHTAERGHIDGMVRRAVRAGVPAIEAVRMGSLNAAQYLHVDHDLGSLTPGRRAHVNVLDDLQDFTVRDVIVGAEVVVRDGVSAPAEDSEPVPTSFRETIRLAAPARAEDFVITASAVLTATVRVIEVDPGILTTREREEDLPVSDGVLAASADRDLAKMAVIDRHERSGRTGRGFVRGTGLRCGAIATTTSPALMNLMVLGMDDEDMAIAANRAAELGGGLVAALDGEVIAEVPLPILGVFSDGTAESTVDRMQAFEQAVAERLGSRFDGLLTVTGFAMMPVSIPGLKLCDRGLVRVARDSVDSVELVVGAAS